MKHVISKRGVGAIIAGAAALLASSAMAQPILIRDVRVFDGQAVHENRSVLIDGNRILEDDFRGTPPADARIVEGAGRTLLPGLIDAHVHAYAGLDDALLFGVTTVLDMFTDLAMTAAARARTRANDNPGEADLRSAGFLATAPGGQPIRLEARRAKTKAQGLPLDGVNPNRIRSPPSQAKAKLYRSPLLQT